MAGQITKVARLFGNRAWAGIGILVAAAVAYSIWVLSERINTIEGEARIQVQNAELRVQNAEIRVEKTELQLEAQKSQLEAQNIALETLRNSASANTSQLQGLRAEIQHYKQTQEKQNRGYQRLAAENDLIWDMLNESRGRLGLDPLPRPSPPPTKKNTSGPVGKGPPSGKPPQ